MLSVVTRLPDGPPTVGGSGETGVRICCATSSVDHPKKPEQPGLNRMTIKISGFILEDDGAGGCRLTQITDLSGLGGALAVAEFAWTGTLQVTDPSVVRTALSHRQAGSPIR